MILKTSQVTQWVWVQTMRLYFQSRNKDKETKKRRYYRKFPRTSCPHLVSDNSLQPASAAPEWLSVFLDFPTCGTIPCTWLSSLSTWFISVLPPFPCRHLLFISELSSFDCHRLFFRAHAPVQGCRMFLVWCDNEHSSYKHLSADVLWEHKFSFLLGKHSEEAVIAYGKCMFNILKKKRLIVALMRTKAISPSVWTQRTISLREFLFVEITHETPAQNWRINSVQTLNCLWDWVHRSACTEQLVRLVGVRQLCCSGLLPAAAAREISYELGAWRKIYLRKVCPIF